MWREVRGDWRGRRRKSNGGRPGGEHLTGAGRAGGGGSWAVSHPATVSWPPGVPASPLGWCCHSALSFLLCPLEHRPGHSDSAMASSPGCPETPDGLGDVIFVSSGGKWRASSEAQIGSQPRVLRQPRPERSVPGSACLGCPGDPGLSVNARIPGQQSYQGQEEGSILGPSPPPTPTTCPCRALLGVGFGLVTRLGRQERPVALLSLLLSPCSLGL